MMDWLLVPIASVVLVATLVLLGHRRRPIPEQRAAERDRDIARLERELGLVEYPPPPRGPGGGSRHLHTPGSIIYRNGHIPVATICSKCHAVLDDRADGLTGMGVTRRGNPGRYVNGRLAYEFSRGGWIRT